LTVLAGGILGFFCHHQYAHSSETGRKSIPMAFKGVDLAVYSVFQALGLKVGVHPTIENRSGRMGGLSAKILMSPPSRSDGDHVDNCIAELAAKKEVDYDEDDYEEDDYEEDRTTIVGTKLHGPTFDDDYEENSGKVNHYPLKTTELFNLMHY
jgi:hypothetical protein